VRLDPSRWPSPVAISHRGSRFLWPENTSKAFAEALGLGFRHIETDLHLTADGVLVCFHDHLLYRTTGEAGLVSERTFDELGRLDAGFRHDRGTTFPFRDQGVTIPSLEEVLTTHPEVTIVVDLKEDGLEAPLARLIEDLRVAQRLIVGSFHDRRLREFRRLTNGTVPTSTSPRETMAMIAASRRGRPISSDAAALLVPTHWWGLRVVDDRLVDSAHLAGMQIHVWTVNTVNEMNRLLDLGVDGLITDRPDLAKTTLQQRGLWR